MHVHLLEVYCLRIIYLPFLVGGDEIFSEFFVYVYTSCRAKQYRTDSRKAAEKILRRGRGETVPDQWQAQILLRILKRASVVFVSEAPDEMIRNMHMIPAHSIGEALAMAKDILGNDSPTVTAIPDGISVMVVE